MASPEEAIEALMERLKEPRLSTEMFAEITRRIDVLKSMAS